MVVLPLMSFCNVRPSLVARNPAAKQYNGRPALEALGHICGISIGRPAQ